LIATDIDAERFFLARQRVLSEANKHSGIGTLAEKALHSILKYYFEPSDEFHEVKYKGAVADIKRGNSIVEIQSASLKRLSGKLDKFLPECSVAVVYPLAAEKRIHVIDRESGEISAPRKSPKISSPCDVFDELWGLEKFLFRDGFSIVLVFVDVDEYRYAAPKGKYRPRATVRAERIPTRIREIITLSDKSDYAALIPQELAEAFTVKELAALIHRKPRYAQGMITALVRMGILKKVGERGRAYLYSRT